jgi:hypothetical protein
MWIDINQNNDEWLDLRIGKVTGSSVGKVMANYGKAFGAPAKKLAINLAIERSTDKRVQRDEYKNDHMDRGHEEEPIARMLYEDTLFCDVSNGGFYDNGETGCSPDGLVDADGVVEIKSVIATTHYATIKRGGYDPSYKWQYIFNLRESGRDWLDFVSFCSSYTENKKLYVYRITKESIKTSLGMVEKRLEKFEKVISQIMREVE